MADEAQPITNSSISGSLTPRDDEADQKVGVKALARFPKDGSPHGDLVNVGDSFEVERSRAAELRANGLVEYVIDSDAKDIHGHDALRLAGRAQLRKDQDKIDERNKTTPLRNPLIELDDTDIMSDGKK